MPTREIIVQMNPASMHDMPTFLVIGAARSGTTAIHKYLQQHPTIFMSEPKESNFFAFEGEPLNYQGPGADYVNNSVSSLGQYQTLFSNAPQDAARGEVCPLYLYAENAPKRIHDRLPNVKLIAILRNPIEQAHSHYLYAQRQMLEPLQDFGEAIKLESQRKQAHWQPLFQYSTFPMYYQQLCRYYDCFSPDQIKIFLYEDIQNDLVGSLQSMFEFIDVDKTFVPDTSYRPNAGGVPKNSWLQGIVMKPYLITRLVGSLIPLSVRMKIKDAISERNLVNPGIPAGAADQLKAVLEADILRLQDLLGRDLSTWLQTEGN